MSQPTVSNETVKIFIKGVEYDLPLVEGSEGELGIDIRQLRSLTNGIITFDSGYANTGSCQSTITFIDGEKGILRYRGYPIEQLASHASFTEVMFLVIYGNLPSKSELDKFELELTNHDLIHEDMKTMFNGFPPRAHPMAILSSMITSLSTYYPETNNDDLQIIRLLAKAKTLAAYAYKKSQGHPYIYPDNNLGYVDDFIHMMFSLPTETYTVNPVISDALNKLLILHADHEQNCSASTVRMVGSSVGSIYTAIAAGISALWGPLHGGANQAVVEMLQKIQDEWDGQVSKAIEMAKDKTNEFRLMGFGHRVYKNFDPRANILKEAADNVLIELGLDDPLLDIAQQLEKVALEDEYFIQRKLYPNVDFYSGIIYRALGIPTNMFTVIFALGRLPGWIAQWKEMRDDPNFRIHRPRQIYVGENKRDYVPLEERF